MRRLTGAERAFLQEMIDDAGQVHDDLTVVLGADSPATVAVKHVLDWLSGVRDSGFLVTVTREEQEKRREAARPPANMDPLPGLPAVPEP